MSDKGKNGKSHGDNSPQEDTSDLDLEFVGDDQPDVTMKSAPDDHEKWKSEFLYLKAEFENYKKQMIKERSDLIKYGSERLINSLLDVLDVFDKALEMEVSPDSLDAFVTGVRMTSDELNGALSRFGVVGFNPTGEAFDPSMHEALSSFETKDVSPGHVAQVYRRGYKLHDRILRPAQVVVAKEPAKNPGNNN